MSRIRFDVISIGTLGRNRLWGEQEIVRSAHSTTTLIRAGKRSILVDPGLPALALGARLYERTGLSPSQIDTVFLTSFRPEHRAGYSLFGSAKFLIHEIEQQAARQQIEHLIGQAPEEDDDRQYLEKELKLLDSMQLAQDEIAENVDLFPLFGVTRGSCGLLLTLPTQSVLIAGAAVASQEHFLAGQILPEAVDLDQAKETLAEIYEIADLIVPGYDNIFMNPRAYGI